MADRTVRLDDHEGWLLSLTDDEKKAFLGVRLFLSAVGRLEIDHCNQSSFLVEEMHKYFPIFAKEMRWPGPLYEAEPSTGRCQAVTLFLRDDVPREFGGLWLVSPFAEHLRDVLILNESPVKEKLLEAARAVCRQWLPNWNW